MEETGFRNGHSSNFIDAAAEAGDINCLLSICFRRLEPGRGLTGAKSLLMRVRSDGGTAERRHLGPGRLFCTSTAYVEPGVGH